VKWRTKKAVSCGIFAKKGTLSLSFDHISMIWRQWRQDKTGDWWKGSQVSPGQIFLNPREVCTTRLGLRLAFICAQIGTAAPTSRAILISFVTIPTLSFSSLFISSHTSSQ